MRLINNKDFLLWIGCCFNLLILDVQGLDYLHLIDHYEVVEPLHIGQHARHKRDLSTRYDTNTHLDETTFQIRGLNKNFIIEVTKNTLLLPPTYSLIHQGDGSISGQGNTSAVENCFYHGKIMGQEASNVVLSTCNGLSGLIEDVDEESYFIEPTNTGSHILFNMKDLRKEREVSCGLNHTDEANHFLHTKHNIYSMKDHLRQRRSTNKKYVETIVVIDNRRNQQLGGVKKSEERAISLMNYVDSVYKTMNTRVALTNVVVWNQADMITISANAGSVLKQFKSYSANVLHKQWKLYPDNVQLVTGHRFTGSLVGLAGIGVICSLTSCAVNYDHTSNAGVSASTIAHEMGHNFGFYHNKKGCICPKKPCVMNSILSGSNVQSFTSCSSSRYERIENAGDYPCLYDYPDKLFSKASCGNGYLEKGEACDCGTEEDCKASGADKCCDFKTCTLHSSAKCADGPCCKNCQFKGQGALCRKKTHPECDLQEYCTGTTSECPRNSYISDGGPCGSGEGLCYQGLCKTHSVQCQALWGENAMKAIDVCFDSNKDGDGFGNCGKDMRDQLIKCATKDILCGKIQCQAQEGKSLPRFPLLGSGKSVEIKNRGGVSCRVAKATFSAEESDPTLTAEGTKCAQNSICFENKCKNIATLGTSKQCKRECKNGGVCNNNGNCHCPVGLACPYCELAGPGGSLDSGQGCLLQDDCASLTPLVKGLLVLFLLVLPLCALIGYMLFRNKDQLRSRWKVYRQRKRGEKTPGRRDDKATKISTTTTNTRMQTGVPKTPPSRNPYITSSTQPSVHQLPPSSGKLRPPPKVPPIGISSPGKLRQPTKVPPIGSSSPGKLRQPPKVSPIGSSSPGKLRQPPKVPPIGSSSPGKLRPPPKVPPIGSSSPGKLRQPPMLPPIGSSSPGKLPGKLPQIAAYNQMDVKATDSHRVPNVAVRGGKTYR